jgi:methionyl-tRNA formyltransferase
MRVLLLSPYADKIARIFRNASDDVVADDGSARMAVYPPDADWVVSYGYRFMVPPAVVNTRPGRVINIHIGYLPWCRGADPNFWSWFDRTPKGVTIHQVDEGLDTGPILSQCGFTSTAENTLATSYHQLHRIAVSLFESAWPAIRSGHLPTRPQPAGGTFHRKKDREAIWHHFPLGWDTPCRAVEEIGQQLRVEHEAINSLPQVGS